MEKEQQVLLLMVRRGHASWAEYYAYAIVADIYQILSVLRCGVFLWPLVIEVSPSPLGLQAVSAVNHYGQKLSWMINFDLA